MSGIFLLLGSNMGMPRDNLSQALDHIQNSGIEIIEMSAVYQSEPWGVSEQPWFLNMVIRVSTLLSENDLLKEVLRIEDAMGRQRTKKWGPRLIDIDILIFGSKIVHREDLHIPHPGIPDRKFTLIPLCQLAPDLVHPELGKTMSTLLNETTDPLECTLSPRGL